MHTFGLGRRRSPRSRSRTSHGGATRRRTAHGGERGAGPEGADHRCVRPPRLLPRPTGRRGDHLRADLAKRFKKPPVLVKGAGLAVATGRPYFDPTSTTSASARHRPPRARLPAAGSRRGTSTSPSDDCHCDRDIESRTCSARRARAGSWSRRAARRSRATSGESERGSSRSAPDRGERRAHDLRVRGRSSAARPAAASEGPRAGPRAQRGARAPCPASSCSDGLGGRPETLGRNRKASVCVRGSCERPAAAGEAGAATQDPGLRAPRRGHVVSSHALTLRRRRAGVKERAKRVSTGRPQMRRGGRPQSGRAGRRVWARRRARG